MHRRIPIVLSALVIVLTGCGGGSAPDAAPASAAQEPTTSSEATTVATTAPASTLAADEPDAIAPPDAAGSPEVPDDECAHVVAVDVIPEGDSTYGFAVTVRSDDQGWDKYADGWEVRSEDGTVLGFRELTHPHETEQPFTRSLFGVEIPADVDEVEVFARDSVVGYCGMSYSVSISG